MITELLARLHSLLYLRPIDVPRRLYLGLRRLVQLLHLPRRLYYGLRRLVRFV